MVLNWVALVSSEKPRVWELHYISLSPMPDVSLKKHLIGENSVCVCITVLVVLVGVRVADLEKREALTAVWNIIPGIIYAFLLPPWGSDFWINLL